MQARSSSLIISVVSCVALLSASVASSAHAASGEPDTQAPRARNVKTFAWMALGLGVCAGVGAVAMGAGVAAPMRASLGSERERLAEHTSNANTQAYLQGLEQQAGGFTAASIAMGVGGAAFLATGAALLIMDATRGADDSSLSMAPVFAPRVGGAEVGVIAQF